MAKSKVLTRRPYSLRQVASKEPLERFLIVCEGERTEPNYFEGFRVPSVVLDIHGTGFNTLRVVQEAIRLKLEGRYDQVWCVFDRDIFPAQHFNEAIRLAVQAGIQVAYSNEAFELWYLLHFDFHDTAIRRADYITKLEAKIGKKYKKNSGDMYDILESRQETAVQHAK